MPPHAFHGASPDDSSNLLNPARAASLLQELKDSHGVLEAAVADIEAATIAAKPDLTRYPHARWRLSTDRRQRQAVTSTIYTEVRPTLRPHELQAFEQWHSEDNQRLLASAQHVRVWTTERIAADWRGYCSASDTLRRSLRQWIAAERVLIYPLLENRSLR